MGHYRMIPDKSVEILLGELSRDIAQRTPGTGDFPTAVEGLELFRRNEPAPPVSCLVPPSIVLVADGAKIMWVGGEPYEYNAEKFLITSLDLPASSEILQASTSQPCVGVAYKLDQRVLMELIAQGSLPPVKKRDAGTSVGIGTITDALLEPFCRLLSLLDEPEAIPVLGPLIQREIHYRLLMSDQSDHLRQIAAVDGHGYRIGKAIDWLKTNIASPLRVEELASRVQMSSTSWFLARQMPEMALTVITPSIRILQTLMSRRSLHLVGLGGDFSPTEESFFGETASRTLREYAIDTLFFSCQGLERDSGLYAGTQAHAALLKQMLLAARQTVALVDGSKLGRTGVARIGGLGELDCLVTERFVDPLLEKEMTWHNVSLQIA